MLFHIIHDVSMPPLSFVQNNLSVLSLARLKFRFVYLFVSRHISELDFAR